jgi:hypothetical protein
MARVLRWTVRKLLRAIAIFLLCFLVVELGVRFYVLRWQPQLRELAHTFQPDPATGYSLVPNRSLEAPGNANAGGHSWHFDSNAQGLRGPDLAPRVPGQCRLLMLGGSYVYGIGVEASETAAALLEAHLRASSDRPVLVINAGTPAFGLVEQYRQYLARGADLDVDGVVLPYLQRDDLDGLRHFKLADGMLFTDPVLFAGHPSFVIEFLAGDNIYVHESHDSFRHLIKHVVFRRPEDIIPRRATATFDPAIKSWEVIEDLQRLASTRNQPFLLANFPFWESSPFAPGADPGHPAHAKTKAAPWAQDFFPVFWATSSSPYLDGDHHWNELGHRLVADALFPWASEVCQKVWERSAPRLVTPPDK